MRSLRIGSPRPPRRARIEIIPLIDIMFFLLATFVMVSLSMVKSKGLPVHLPAAATGKMQDRESAITVTVTEANEIFFDRQPVALPDLPATLRKLHTARPDARILLNGDARSLLGATITVLDEAHRAGITEIAFETQTKR